MVTNLLSVGYLTQQIISPIEVINAFLITLIAWTLLWTEFPRKHLYYLLLPYLTTTLFMAFYCYRHHLGILLLLFIWYAWISLQDQPSFTTQLRPYFQKLDRLFLILC